MMEPPSSGSGSGLVGSANLESGFISKLYGYETLVPSMKEYRI